MCTFCIVCKTFLSIYPSQCLMCIDLNYSFVKSQWSPSPPEGLSDLVSCNTNSLNLYSFNCSPKNIHSIPFHTWICWQLSQTFHDNIPHIYTTLPFKHFKNHSFWLQINHIRFPIGVKRPLVYSWRGSSD